MRPQPRLSRMLYGRLLSRPAAAEVRQMLHRIKMENVERGRRVTTAYMEAVTTEASASATPPSEAPLFGGGGRSNLWRRLPSLERHKDDL